MNTLNYKGHCIHIRWIGIKQVAYRVQLFAQNKFIFKNAKSLKAAQVLITQFVNDLRSNT